MTVASGGTEFDDGIYQYHEFTTSGTLEVSSGGSVEFLLVAGGGGGGRAGSVGGGGGAGGVLVGETTVTAQSYSIVVGAGGAGRTGSTGAGGDGGDSTFNGNTAVGGGGGASGNSTNAGDGGSGGGGGLSTGGSGTAGQGNDGGAGFDGTTPEDAAGGGGGASAVGGSGASEQGGNGGDGTTVWSLYTVGGGGGGGCRDANATRGDGGVGGGGRGGTTATAGGAGTPNTGGGGGGGGNNSDGGNGGSGIVVIRYLLAAGLEITPAGPTVEVTPGTVTVQVDDTQAIETDGPTVDVTPGTVTVQTTVDPETPTAIAGTDTSSLADPADRAGKGQRWAWWTGTQWDAVLPTGDGWKLYTDLTGSIVAGAVVDDRQDTRVDTVFHDGSLWVLRGHDTTPEITRYDLNGTYSADGDVTDVAVTALAAADHDASPAILFRSANGRLWAAVNNGTNVVVAISDDDGQNWTSANVLSVSETGVVMLAQAGTTVVLISTENSGGGRAVRTIAQDAVSITSGSWSTENLPGLPSGVVSDDHGMATAVDGHVYAVAKTGDAIAGQPLLYLVDRTVGGTWSHTLLVEGPDNSGPTRPHLVGTNARLYVAYGRNQAPTDANLLAIPRDTLDVPSPASLLAEGNHADGAIPPREANGQSGLLWLIHERTSETIWRVWQPLPTELVFDGATVEATPSVLSMAVDVPLDVPAVEATPGAVAIGQSITLDAPTVTATPGTATLGPVVEPEPVVIEASPGALSMSIGIAPVGAAVDVTPGAVELDLAVTLDGAAITATPGSVTIATGAAIEPGAVTVEATPGTLTLTQGLAVVADGPHVDVTPGTLTVTTGPTHITPAPAAVDVTPGALIVGRSVVLAAPAVEATPGAVSVVVGAANITPAPLTVEVVPGVLVVEGGETADPHPVRGVYREPSGYGVYREPRGAAYQEDT